MAACAHVDPAAGEPDLSYIASSLPGLPVVLVNVSVRELGLLVWTGNPRKIEGVGDLGRLGLRFVNRQPGSATRAFTDAALAAAGIEQAGIVGYREEVWTHWAVALRVLRAEADVGVAARAVASALSLGFIPLARERLDLVVPKARFFQPAIQALIEAVRSERFRRGLERLGGYDWGGPVACWERWRDGIGLAGWRCGRAASGPCRSVRVQSSPSGGTSQLGVATARRSSPRSAPVDNRTLE